MANHNDLGKEGELLAFNFLKQQGYTILDTNWRYQKAEVDIIALQNNLLCIIEVKTRSSDFFGNPEEFVTQQKQKLLIDAADAYIQQKNIDYEVRFDIIAILKKEKKHQINHIIDAFHVF